ncbi:HNH endonuclease signature motif containing protein [Microbacterium sp.]|uniref:HNH endonuclease signature motif containing protein n=1 Tax=Microbacterium sp. TaxID=51671 RepID=UPI002606FE18|nr:HNH endonuclease signature motif containing protein [Microbacterium sp.]
MEQFVDDVDDMPRDAAFVVAHALDDLQCAEIDMNRYAARRAAQIADAVSLARRNPEAYLLECGSDAADEAERAVIFDISLRLKRSEDDVRAELWTVQTAMRQLPTLWLHARDGFVSMYLVSRAVWALGRLQAPFNATPEQRAAEREAARLIDEATAEWAFSCSPENFLRRLRRLVKRLDPEPAEERHARALSDRRVAVEHEEDGMSWINAYVPTTEALAVDRRLTATAKQVKKGDPCEVRTIAQIRADLFSEWLRGVGTARAAQTKVFVTIPVQLLAGDGAAVLPTPTAEIVGHGPIDPLTAKQLFLDTGVFRRVIVDPIDGVVIDMERRSRYATTAQRDWLILQHGTCSRDGCTRLALDADIDHRVPWAQGGRTNLGELRPLCPRDHASRHRTRAVYRSRPDGSVEVTTPTGFRTTAPPSENHADLPFARRADAPEHHTNVRSATLAAPF